MSKLFAKYATDKTAEEDGTWAEFGDGVAVKIRRMNSKFVQEVRKKLERPYRDMIQRGTLPDNVAEELLLKQMVQGIIADWKGVEDQDNNALAFNEKNATMILNALPDFKSEILSISINREAFRDKAIEEAQGNSDAA